LPVVAVLAALCFWVAGVYFSPFASPPWYDLLAWLIGIVLGLIASAWAGRKLLVFLGGKSRLVRWVVLGLVAGVGLTGWGFWALAYALVAVMGVVTEPRQVASPAECMMGSGAEMIEGVVEEWTSCRGADESFMQGRLLYLEGEGMADPEACTTLIAGASKSPLEPTATWCDPLKPQLWAKAECPAFVPSSAHHCLSCATLSKTYDTYNVQLSFTEDCTGVHVLRGTNVDLEKVSQRAAGVQP